MRFRFLLAASILLGTSCGPGNSQDGGARLRMPIFVTPYYDSKGPTIAVGEFSQPLVKADDKSISEVVDRLNKQKEKLRFDVMYVTAIRLYDLGHKDDAVEWFYAAQHRAFLFNKILDKEHIGGIGDNAFELRASYRAFNQLAGVYINGFAYGDLAKVEKTLNKVVDEANVLPKFDQLYPGVKFIPSSEWPDKNVEQMKDLNGLIEYVQKNRDQIKQERTKNGIDGKY